GQPLLLGRLLPPGNARQGFGRRHGSPSAWIRLPYRSLAKTVERECGNVFKFFNLSLGIPKPAEKQGISPKTALIGTSKRVRCRWRIGSARRDAGVRQISAGSVVARRARSGRGCR